MHPGLGLVLVFHEASSPLGAAERAASSEQPADQPQAANPDPGRLLPTLGMPTHKRSPSPVLQRMRQAGGSTEA